MRAACKPTPTRGKPPAQPPAANTASQRVWSAMRILRSFTIADLAATTETPEDTVYKILHPLCRAGYIAATNERSLARRVFRLVRDTGTRVPRIRRRQVTDRNNGREYQLAVRRQR